MFNKIIRGEEVMEEEEKEKKKLKQTTAMFTLF